MEKVIILPTRGADRLFHPEQLPVYDAAAAVKYEGSISKTGDNADWDWGMFRDEHGEWVLMEADGAGCIFNFTQHRYPTSRVPTFRFYFDGADEPTLTVIPADFGNCDALPSPYAGRFVGPEENGRGPIWVVRSFVPMPFRTHCKVTCDFRLEGFDKSLGQGGWGHVMYQVYDTPDGITTYDGSFDPAALTAVYDDWNGSTPVPTVSPLLPGGSRTITEISGRGALRGLYAAVKNFTGLHMTDLWFTLCFDGTPCVSAPLGTLFGCEYGDLPAHLNTVFLEQDTTGETAFFRNTFPMPYQHSVTVTAENRSDRTILFGASVKADPSLCYDPETTGYFTAAPYYPETPNTEHANSVIADVTGAGAVVYAVLTGHHIRNAGCEGDVRVFVDDMNSPTVESDGSESWASYGWGFVAPPQSNPFSAYNGVPGSNADWSELRLTPGDSYVFRNRLRFELEHGACNNGGGAHSGQVFYYSAPKTPEIPAGSFEPGRGLISDGEAEVIKDRFENGIHERYETFTVLRRARATSFTCSLPAENKGLVLRRAGMQKEGPTAAKVFVDGKEVTERTWLFPDSNEYYSLIEDDFFVPAGYTAGKTSVCVTICPLDGHWTECRYRTAALL